MEVFHSQSKGKGWHRLTKAGRGWQGVLKCFKVSQVVSKCGKAWHGLARCRKEGPKNGAPQFAPGTIVILQ